MDIYARTICAAAMLGVLSTTAGARAEDAEPIEGDEQVIFFPSVASPSEDGRLWRCEIRGWVFEPEADSWRRAAAIGALRRMLGLKVGDPSSTVFYDRCRALLVDNERGTSISVKIGDEVFPIGVSAEDGQFTALLELEADFTAQFARELSPGVRWLSFTAALPEGDGRVFAGRVQLIPAEGRSVVSDIDDTIKVTEVRDRKALLRNTFLRDFERVPGMSDVYQGWNAEDTVFHYVSASPCQLNTALSQFLTDAQFPSGSLHLRSFRFTPGKLAEMLSTPDRSKRRHIESLLTRFPKRKVVLVGDSGERDPELYGELYRAFPNQIERIFIRDVSQDAVDSIRYQQAFQDVPADRWTLFLDASELPKTLSAE